MTTGLIVSVAGFITSGILLVCFINRYKRICINISQTDALKSQDSYSGIFNEDYEEDTTKHPVRSEQYIKSKPLNTKTLVELNAKDINIDRKINILADSIEDIKVQESIRADELNKIISDIEKRMTDFEKEYLNKLQPALSGLIKELEKIPKK